MKLSTCFVTVLVASAMGGSIAGCVLGPAALEMSRVRYNEVIQKTTDEQLLLNLVRLRYREAPSFLEVGSVSTQFSFGQSANATGTIHEGPSSLNPGRLDLRAGINYEERPTVTFTPLQGKDFVRKLLSTLQPDVVVLLSRSGWSIDRVLRVTVQAMNGLDNASSASGPTPATAPRFEEFARVSRSFRKLQEEGLLKLGYESHKTDLLTPIPADRVSLSEVVDAAAKGFALRYTDAGRSVIVTGSSPVLVWRIPPKAVDHPQVRAIVERLKLPPGRSRYVIGTGSNDGTDIRFSMRSLMGTLFYLSQAVEVPQQHTDEGIVTQTHDRNKQPFDWGRVTGDLLRVRWHPSRPARAAVAIQHRGGWYYIDDADLPTKSTFVLLGQLFALQAGGIETTAPVLTLPIGG